MTTPTYAEVGATRELVDNPAAPLPSGYRQLRHRARIGQGETVFAKATDALLHWRMHQAVGVRPHASASKAAPGVEITTKVPFPASCVVVWVVENHAHSGFGYGTLPSHPFSGEEAFVLTLDPDETVWFSVLAFSRAHHWYTKVAGPVAPLFQRLYARRCTTKLKALAS